MAMTHRTSINSPAFAGPFRHGQTAGLQSISPMEHPSDFPAKAPSLMDELHQEGTPCTGQARLTPTPGISNPLQLRFTLLRYGHQRFPDAMNPLLAEVPAHFDVTGLKVDGPYSLHSEYCSKARKFNSPLLDGLDVLKGSHRKMVPELWTSEAWAREFAQFIFRLAGLNAPPHIIEVHPPFQDGKQTMEGFLDIYSIFESEILARFPDCRFVIENRAGTKHPKPFLVSGADSLLALGKALAVGNLKLGIALDLPQLYTHEHGSKHLVGREVTTLLEKLLPIHDQIHTLHLWGRGPMGGAHSGDLDGLFDPKTGAKQACLEVLRTMFDDCRPRFLVLEVSHKAGELVAILDDLQKAGFQIGTGL